MNSFGSIDAAGHSRSYLTGNRPRRDQDAWLAAVACFALAMGLLVYLTDRDPRNSILIPSVGALAGQHWFGALGARLPSFVHPLAFGLLTAVALPPNGVSRYGACLAWCGVNVAFEIGQHPSVSPRLAEALVMMFGETRVTAPLANYFVRGTFDIGDIVAALLGALVAAAALRPAQPVSGR